MRKNLLRLCLATSILSPTAWAQAVDYESMRRPAQEVHVRDLPSHHKEIDNLVAEFLASYTRLYFAFPKAFSPYNESDAVHPFNLRKQLCNGTFEDLCTSSVFSQKLTENFKIHEFVSQNFDDPDDSDDDLFLRPWKKLHSSVEVLKQKFHKFQKSYLAKLGEIASSDEVLETVESFTKVLDRVRALTKDDADAYIRELQERASVYPERILLSKRFLELIEGKHYKVEYTDIIEAVEEVTKSLREQFLFDLVSLMASLPSSERTKYIHTWDTSFDILKGRKLDMSLYDLWKKETLDFKAPVPKFSKVHIPKTVNEKSLDLLRNFDVWDATFVDFMIRNSFQRAAWHLRDLEYSEYADELEEIIEDEIFQADKVTSIRKLGGGAGTTMLVSFKDGARCVYKPSGINLRNPVDFFITDANNEAAASVMDRLLDLRMVPLTVKKKLGEYSEGSCQYFAENTVRAREMLAYSGDRPSKFSKPSGRATKTTDMLYFDMLISNWDRNVDNYIFSLDGRLFGIDHGYSFKDFAPHPILWMQLKKMIPSERVFQRLVELHENPKKLETALKPYLSIDQIWMIKKKIHSTLKLMEKHQVYPEL